MTTSCFGLRSGSVNMESELTSRGRGFNGIFGSTPKPRPPRFQPSGLFSVAHGLHVFALLAIVNFFVMFILDL